MKIKNRIKEVREMKLKDIRPNPKNWRTHGEAQRNAFKGILSEVGWAGSVLAYEPEDGQGLMLLDGHLRGEEVPDMNVPVVVLDITDKEAEYLLATIDPISAMAGANQERLQEVMDGITTKNEAVKQMLDDLMATHGLTDIEPPETFNEFDDSIPTEHTCPKCGFKWSGSS